MKRTLTLVTMAALAALSTYGGGFYLQLGNPDASAEARAAKAVVTLLATGCHEPGKAEITGVAISKSNRQSIPLKVTKLSRPGMFAVAQQWPAEGTWVLQFTARNDGAVTSAIVTAGPEGVDRATAKYVRGEPTREDVETLLAKK
jgi:hypothetical protein